ncbi:putative short chain dehydrogenase reductase protein [Botrytis fragariae]|uniref:Putative short chain dehydrogenase reductase protein n=1 Tax=Botrytis fragariae TaxID=1964551 RepID=A0A8H6AM94_9HELO|nr:putative short chain dehydrogenase reductase protein [Botrytis fragariae]KAF5870353.1 putative short chain dehydrogenase reductase protein [Botrytis fragariae]
MSSSVPSLAPGNTALITGGASGIGFSFAETCVKAGLNVILVDNNGDNLGAAQTYLSQLNGEGQVVGLNIDVGVEEEWESIKDVVEEDFDGTLHILFLNAGFSTRGSFATPSSSSYFSKILSVNLFGVINGINTLLPSITSHTNPSSIIITGSKQGITNPPGNPAYNASKAAVKTLAEHLSYDLREKKNVGVHLLVPGWTYTGLTGSGSPFIVSADKVEKAGLEKKPKGAWSADQVTEYLQEKMGEGKFYIVCPDGDVSEEMDRKRMAWGAGDVVNGRLPLSRWREEYKAEFEEFVKKDL